MAQRIQHLVVFKFREGADIEDILKKVEKLASEMESVESFIWGEDTKTPELLRNGFTHAFIMTFSSEADLTAFIRHPKHLEFQTSFASAVRSGLVIDIPAVTVKAPPS